MEIKSIEFVNVLGRSEWLDDDVVLVLGRPELVDALLEVGDFELELRPYLLLHSIMTNVIYKGDFKGSTQSVIYET